MKQANLKFSLPQADIDDIFHYKISAGRQIDDYCRIRIYKLKPTICILTELKNSGMSVTNSVEKIIPQLRQLLKDEGNPLPENTIFIEHYDRDSYEGSDLEDNFSLVTLNNNKPIWQHISAQAVFELMK